MSCDTRALPASRLSMLRAFAHRRAASGRGDRYVQYVVRGTAALSEAMAVASEAGDASALAIERLATERRQSGTLKGDAALALLSFETLLDV